MSDLAKIQDQHDDVKKSSERYPVVSQFLLHTACIDWLHKEFNPDHESDL